MIDLQEERYWKYLLLCPQGESTNPQPLPPEKIGSSNSQLLFPYPNRYDPVVLPKIDLVISGEKSLQEEANAQIVVGQLTQMISSTQEILKIFFQRF